MPGRSRTTARFAPRVLLVLLAAVVAPPSAFADGRVGFLADRLKYPPNGGQPDDFRVRTNAALALGASDDEQAVAPLCGALADPNDLVRQAVVLALKRLARGSAGPCLRKRLPIESSVAIRRQIEHAIEAVESAGAAAAPGTPNAVPFVEKAKFYVSISPIANNTERPTAEIERTVRAAIASKLNELGSYQVAPASESDEAARAVVSRRKLKGFHLAVRVEKFDYSEGNLRVRLKIAVFSYPSKDLRGEVPAGATLPGAKPGDPGVEDQLIGLVASRAAELFAQNFR